MTEKDVVRALMERQRMTHQEMAVRIGLSGANGVTNLLSERHGNRMRVDSLLRFLDALGYELVVRCKKDCDIAPEYVVE